MNQYIDKEEVITELKRRIEAHKETLKNCDSSISEMVLKGSMSAYQSLLHFFGTLEVKEIEPTKVPKHSYFETIYHCGTEPIWKIGDVLAVYEFYSDREGEQVYGEVIDVKMDEDYSDWVYTIKGDFGGYEDICENELIREQAYKKNK